MFLKYALLAIVTISPVILGSSDFEKRFDELAKETAEFGRRLTHLEVENEALEKRVQRLEEENEQLKSVKATLEERVEYLEIITRKNVPRTCHDLKLLGVTKSGSYLIDPDGPGLGETPITVTCDMRPANGITLVQHNLVDVIMEVEHCPDPGCHATEITYDAPMRQMKALIDLSSKCIQEIQYECFIAPLIANGEINMAWWNGTDGEANYYWDGSHDPMEHTCSCGQDGSCINEIYSCNCDSGALEWLSDVGILSNMTALPVTGVSFGGLVYDSQEAKFAMGPLACQGREFSETASCDTLRMAGHTATGYYFVDGPNGLHRDLVFCDMELESSDANFQVETNVKLPEYPVAFDVSQPTFSQTGADAAVLTWGYTVSNVGATFDPANGRFVAPFRGVYQFTLSVHLYRNRKDFGVEIRKNGYMVAIVWDNSTEDDDNGAGSASTILILEKGDRVDAYMRANGVISCCERAHFMGHLLFPL